MKKDNTLYFVENPIQKSSLSVCGPTNGQYTHFQIKSQGDSGVFTLTDSDQLLDLGNLLIIRASVISEKANSSPSFRPTGIGLNILINGELQRTIYSDNSKELTGPITDYTYAKIKALFPEYADQDCTFVLFTTYDGSISRKVIGLILRTIIIYQRKFLTSCKYADCRRMMLSDISNILCMDESNISRATQSVRIYTSNMIFTLDNNEPNLYIPSLFDPGTLKKDGSICSRIEVLNSISNKISKEDPEHPYTDKEITTYLQESGYCIERRTVVKYRKDFLQIPNSNIRKK